MDSIYEKITYIRTRRKELEGEQRGIEAEWENAYRELEGRKNNFLKKGSAITNQMAQEFQGELMRDQQIADNRKQERTQKLSERHYEFMEDISKKLKDFLAEYNTEKNYMYIFTAGTGLDYMVYQRLII
jgi:predicted Holliday junction resolvase-like endonuclease